MKTDVALLSDRTRPLVERMLLRLAAAGVGFVVVGTLRTAEEQRALYAQGRAPLDVVNGLRKVAGMPPIGKAANQTTVTNRDGDRRKSLHQEGDAIDIVPSDNGRPIWPRPDDPRWIAIAEHGEAVGLEWGGRWKDFPDHPHWQWKGA